MKKTMSVIATVLVGTLGAVGTVHGQSLEEALAIAYSNNPTLLAEQAGLRGTDEGVSQALANWRPTVEMSSSAGVSAIRNNTGTGTTKGQHRDPKSLSLSISQPLYRGGRTVAATREALNTVKAERARLDSVEQTVLLEAATAFMNVVRDQAVLELNTNNEQVLKRQLEATSDRFRVGEITRTDVHQAEARLALATADRIQSEGDLEASRAAFQNVVGQAPEKLSPVEPLTGLPGSEEEAIKTAVAGDPGIIALDFDEKALRHNVTEVRGELLPEVTLSAEASRNLESSSETSRVTTVKGTVSLSVPLYQTGAVYSRLRAARQAVAEKRLGIDQARRDAIEEATRTWEALQTARARIKSLKTSIKAAEVALEGVVRESEVGSRTVLDVLDAEQELLDAKVTLVRAQRDQMVAIFELKTAMGQFTARHLSLPVALYDPETHFREVRMKWVGGRSSGDVK
jgi:outer membrane protein